jgi:hypothetical protein
MSSMVRRQEVSGFSSVRAGAEAEDRRRGGIAGSTGFGGGRSATDGRADTDDDCGN